MRSPFCYCKSASRRQFHKKVLSVKLMVSYYVKIIFFCWDVMTYDQLYTYELLWYWRQLRKYCSFLCVFCFTYMHGIVKIKSCSQSEDLGNTHVTINQKHFVQFSRCGSRLFVLLIESLSIYNEFAKCLFSFWYMFAI